MNAEMAVWGYMLIGLAIAALVIAWIVLPIAIIGTKPILKRILEEQQRTNRLLDVLTPPRPAAPPPPPPSASPRVEPAYLRK
jgi:hypothetical protein